MVYVLGPHQLKYLWFYYCHILVNKEEESEIEKKSSSFFSLSFGQKSSDKSNCIWFGLQMVSSCVHSTHSFYGHEMGLVNKHLNHWNINSWTYTRNWHTHTHKKNHHGIGNWFANGHLSTTRKKLSRSNDSRDRMEEEKVRVHHAHTHTRARPESASSYIIYVVLSILNVYIFTLRLRFVVGCSTIIRNIQCYLFLLVSCIWCCRWLIFSYIRTGKSFIFRARQNDIDWLWQRKMAVWKCTTHNIRLQVKAGIDKKQTPWMLMCAHQNRIQFRFKQ